MAALRFLSFLFLLAAVLVLATDVTRARTEPGQRFWVPLRDHWQEVSPKSLEAARRSIERTHPALWTVVVQPALKPPGWAVFGAAGVLLGYLGRHRRKVQIFVN